MLGGRKGVCGELRAERRDEGEGRGRGGRVGHTAPDFDQDTQMAFVWRSATAKLARERRTMVLRSVEGILVMSLRVWY